MEMKPVLKIEDLKKGQYYLKVTATNPKNFYFKEIIITQEPHIKKTSGSLAVDICIHETGNKYYIFLKDANIPDPNGYNMHTLWLANEKNRVFLQELIDARDVGFNKYIKLVTKFGINKHIQSEFFLHPLLWS